MAINGTTNIEIDVLGTGILTPSYGSRPSLATTSLYWPEDRWLLGWSPWIGFGRATILESHLILRHNGTSVFVRGPHKESDGQMYDLTGSEFFPTGTGRLVKAGETVGIEFLVSNTGYPLTPSGGQANARIYSIKV